MRVRLILLAVFLGLWAGPTACAHPAQIILLRHAEKPADDHDEHLSERGILRAQALPGLILSNSVLAAYGPPVALYVPEHTLHRQSRRPFDTLKPLSERLRLPVLMPHPARSTSLLAREILENPAYDGKTVVVCWVHDFLPDLAQALGVKDQKWSGTVFDRCWVIRFKHDRPFLFKVPQRLLPGDAEK